MVEEEDGDQAEDAEPVPPDLYKMLAELPRNAEIGRRMAELRPDRHQLGERVADLVTMWNGAIELGRIKATLAEIDGLQIGAESGAAAVDLQERYAWEPWVAAADSAAQSELTVLTGDGWPTHFLVNPSDHVAGRTLHVARGFG